MNAAERNLYHVMRILMLADHYPNIWHADNVYIYFAVAEIGTTNEEGES